MEQKEAIFQRIGDAIKHQIIREELPLNYKLPSEFDLVEQFHVSRTTIQRALRYLENQGIIRREKGRGSFVNIQKAKIAMFNFSGFSDYVAKLGKEVVNKLITQEVIKQDNQSLLKLIRLRGMRDQEGITRLTLDQSLLRLELFPDLETHDFENASLYEALRNDYAVSLSIPI